MESDRKEHYRRLLEKRRGQLIHLLEETDDFDMANSLKDSVHELSAYDNHPADLGTETFEREKDRGLLDNARRSLIRVEDALERLDHGNYGTCERCGREIAPDRLSALPDTTLCYDCEEVSELNHDWETRPIEETVLWPPFGRTFLDDTDNVGTDGEDVWQAVAFYGTSETPSDLGGDFSWDNPQMDGDEPEGIVQEVDAVIDHEPDEIPPDPQTRGRRRFRQ